MADRKRKSPPVVTSGVEAFTGHQHEDDDSKRRRILTNNDEHLDSASSKDEVNRMSGMSSNQVEITLQKPSVFAKRGDYFVPLVAIDELGPSVSLLGINLTYTAEEVENLQGQVFYAYGPRRSWNIHTDQSSASSNTNITNDMSHQYENVPSRAVIEDRINASLQARARATNQKYTPTTPGVLGQKVYCTHWMRTGECDFTQQGCMFLHRMPDLPTLGTLGFRDYPRWFREMPQDFQKENANEWREIGNRLFRGVPKEPMPAPPPPPPPSRATRDANVYGTGRRADSPYMQQPKKPQFLTFSHNPPPTYYANTFSSIVNSGVNSSRNSTSDARPDSENGKSKTTAQIHESNSNTTYGSLLSRDGSLSPSNDLLSSYKPMEPTHKREDLPKEPPASIIDALPVGLRSSISSAPEYVHKKRFTDAKFHPSEHPKVDSSGPRPYQAPDNKAGEDKVNGDSSIKNTDVRDSMRLDYGEGA